MSLTQKEVMLHTDILRNFPLRGRLGSTACDGNMTQEEANVSNAVSSQATLPRY